MISVVIPLYNKEKEIEKTLNSVLAQTFQDFEVVVVNDGSTDKSADVVSGFQNEKIRLIHQENQGVSMARNTGVNHARYSYIAFVDADDEWMPDYLSAQAALIKNHPLSHVFASAYKLRTAEGQEIDITLNKISFEGRSGVMDNYFKVASCSSPPVCSSAVIIEKNALLSVGGFPAKVKSGEDLLTWARLAVNYSIVYNRDPLAIYNLPANAEQRTSRLDVRKDFVYDELLNVYAQSIGKQKKDLRKYLGRWNEMRASHFIANGERWATFKPLFRIVKYKGLSMKVLAFFFLLFLPQKQRRSLFYRLKGND